ncbi:hypothetical protein [Micromonospora craterilacus]|uniref:hypothetical protein n=1 Tax=Micromonospora craterilacus TaxID=1655439 RepID=UPI0011B6E163|nr:hypothetical protein [Micromonospora craterilacus]
MASQARTAETARREARRWLAAGLVLLVASTAAAFWAELFKVPLAIGAHTCIAMFFHDLGWRRGWLVRDGQGGGGRG